MRGASWSEPEAQAIIDARVANFLQWVQAREAVPAIRALRGHAAGGFEPDVAVRVDQPGQHIPGHRRHVVRGLRRQRGGEGDPPVDHPEFVADLGLGHEDRALHVQHIAHVP